MDSPFSLQKPVRTFPVDLERRRLDSTFLRGLEVHHLDGKTAALGPAAVHAHQHLSPVLGF